MIAPMSQIIASSLINNDFDVVTHVPGFGGTQVFDEIAKKSPRMPTLCLNEEAAFSISTGASVYGKRAATLVKTHGLAKMANALCSTLSVGNNAANIVIAFDDTLGRSSDNIFDAKAFIAGTEAPYVIVGEDPESDIAKAVDLSEQLQLSVIVYVDCACLDKEFPLVMRTSLYTGSAFKKNPVRFVACPPLAQFQRANFMLKKTDQLHRVRYDNAPAVVQQIPGALPPYLRKVYESYATVFDAFREVDTHFVAGDAGTSTLYAFDRDQIIDICTYMGGAPGMSLGAYMAGAEKSWAITGDFSFLAAGILGWNEIIAQNAPIKVLIFNNGVAGATGGQSVPKRVILNFIRGHKEYIEIMDSGMSKFELLRVLEKMNESNKPQVGIVNIS